MKKFISFIIAALLVAAALAGCTPPKSGGQYTAEFPYDPLQYTLFLKKEISAVANQLTTCAELAVKVSNGQYPAGRAARTANDGLTVIRQCHESVRVMCPPAEYIDTRESVLMQMTVIESDISDLITELEQSGPDKERLIEIKNILLGDCAALTAFADTYWI